MAPSSQRLVVLQQLVQAEQDEDRAAERAAFRADEQVFEEFRIRLQAGNAYTGQPGRVRSVCVVVRSSRIERMVDNVVPCTKMSDDGASIPR